MSPPRVAARFGALLSLLAALPAVAVELTFGEQPVQVDVTSTTNAGWHTGAGGYGELLERLNVAGRTGAWQLGLRLDTATFVSPPSPAIQDRYTLEKASVSWTGRSLEVTLGDAYVSFGRGLALSLRKVDELGADTTLRGLKVLLHEGALGGTLALGTANINNVDEATGKSRDDPYDLVGGLKAQVTLGDLVTVGAHGTGIAFHDAVGLVPGDPYRDRSFQYGATLDAPRLAPWLGLYLEGIGQTRDTGSAPNAGTGFGLYGTATAYLGQATLLLEGKAYGGIKPIQPNLALPELASVAYNNPPTAERVLQVIENPQSHIAGGRMRFDWSFSPALLAYVNYGLFRDWQGYDDPASVGDIRPGTIHDPYAGLEARWNEARSWAIVAMGLRAVVLDGSGEAVRRDAHVEVDVSQALGERWSLTLHSAHRERGQHESPILDQHFREGTVLAGVRYRPWVAVTGGYEYTTEPIQPKRHYVSGNVEWYVTPSSSVRLFVGSARGGLKCVSGVCRTFPPFEGVKLTTTLRF